MITNKYDLVETHIDYIRRRLKEVSDDSYFTDEEIYKSLLDARALIFERRLRKGKDLPDYMYQTICIALCVDEFHDCDCVPTGLDCKVLKTKVDVPKALYNGTTELLRVSTIGGEEIAPTTEAKARYRKYKKTRLTNLYYIRVNKKLAIFNSPQNRLKAIKLTGIFEDPVGAASVTMCVDQDNCIDTVDTGFGTQISDNIDIYNIVLESLINTKNQPDDRTNDSESVPINVKI